MIRIVLENVFFFLLPTLAYIVWVAFAEDEWAGFASVLSRAPLLRLFVAGAALMLGTLIAFSSRSHNSPNDVYVPAQNVDGKLEPAHSIHQPQPNEAVPAKP
ncbi:MAG: DUF6111 family protein [Hyphomicrobium sp.]